MNAEQLAREEPRCQSGHNCPRSHAAHCHDQRLRYDEAQNVSSPRAQRHADPNFVCPLRNKISDYAVLSDEGEDER